MTVQQPHSNSKVDNSLQTVELSIIIPCKNEVNYIGKLLDSLARQTYDLSTTTIYIADAKSDDGTLEYLKSYRQKSSLSIQIIEGGYPSKGRNNGASMTNATYLLFLDADIFLLEDDFIETVIHKSKSKDLDCIGTLVKSDNANWKDKIIWSAMSGMMNLYSIIKPFSSGMCIFIKRSKFIAIGGFDESIILGEDVELTSQIEKKKFDVVKRHVVTTNRRFQKMGYMNTMAIYTKIFFSKSFRHQDNSYYFDQ